MKKAVEELLDGMSSFEDVVDELKDLKDVIIDSNEELIATFVEGTQRIIKKNDTNVPQSIEILAKSTKEGLEAVKKGVNEVERATKSIKLPSNVDFRATGAMLKSPIKELTRTIQDFSLPKTAKEAIPVRLSDGENFYKALDQVIQAFSGGGGSSYAFDKQDSSPTKAATVQVAIGGKQRDAIVVVNPDGTEIGGSSSSGGVQYTDGDATPATPTGTMPVFDSSGTIRAVSDTYGLPVFITNAGQETVATSLSVVLASDQPAIDVQVVEPLNVSQNGTWTVSVDALPNEGQQTMANSISVAIASNQSAIPVTQSGTWDEVGINDSGNSITVDNNGTFVTQIDGAALTSLQLIDDTVATTASAITTKGIAISGTDGTNARVIKTDTSGELQVDVLTMPTVTVTATNLDVQSGGADLATTTQAASIQTAVELIDDTVFVDDADWTADTSKHILVGGVTQVTPTANTDGDVTPFTTDALRQLRHAALESDLATAGTAHVKKYYTNAGAVTDGIIWSPASGKRWFLTHLSINVSAAATVTIEDDLAGGDSVVYKAEFAANSGVVLPFPEVPMFSGEDAADLLITTSAGNVYVTAVGYEV